MIISTQNTKKGLITYSTFIKVDGRLIRLWFSQLVSYLKPEQINNPTFEQAFLHSKQSYLNPEKDKPSGMMYNWIRETNYSKLTGMWHEIQWTEIKLENKGYFGILSDSQGNKYMLAIPPSSTIRYDYITVDGEYHYDCKKDEFIGIEIIAKSK